MWTNEWMNETKAKLASQLNQVKSNPFNSECKLVSLTNEQRVRIFIKCSAIRTNRNHNANCWMMATVLSHFNRRWMVSNTNIYTHAKTNQHIDTFHSVESTLNKYTRGFSFTSYSTWVNVNVNVWHFIWFSFGKSYMTVKRCERCTKIRHYAASIPTRIILPYTKISCIGMNGKQNGTQTKMNRVMYG